MTGRIYSPRPEPEVLGAAVADGRRAQAVAVVDSRTVPAVVAVAGNRRLEALAADSSRTLVVSSVLPNP